MATLNANQRAAGFYTAEGESTPESPLPEQFVSVFPGPSPFTEQLDTPTDFAAFNSGSNSAVVQRAPRMVGMRYLYGRGMDRQPIQPLGACAIPRPWISRAQPDLEGPIHDAGFNDRLFQAGYPGFNLGLSFKVPTLPTKNAPAKNQVFAPINISNAVNRLRRPSGTPRVRNEKPQPNPPVQKRAKP